MPQLALRPVRSLHYMPAQFHNSGDQDLDTGTHDVLRELYLRYQKLFLAENSNAQGFLFLDRVLAISRRTDREEV